jgi:uncharacterized glyoxalase superfamily metalloenzyme YdcJ
MLQVVAGCNCKSMRDDRELRKQLDCLSAPQVVARQRSGASKVGVNELTPEQGSFDLD